MELLLLELLDDVCFRLRMHQVVAQTIHLSIGYSKQTGGGFSRQKKMGRDSNLSQDIFPHSLTILYTHMIWNSDSLHWDLPIKHKH
ncbi:DNA polymerase IV [Priestia megaterium Q3]|uniref:DNA polymerase IV n=1 Tax=Priestia megaterium Q3 TaxID=1452722 RepID=A0A806TJT3_PRIMG|nr:hypothetical protein [Priestia megaterium]AKP78630.1 DNA polymerase IV [Priestia megaterium Q3]